MDYLIGCRACGAARPGAPALAALAGARGPVPDCAGLGTAGVGDWGVAMLFAWTGGPDYCN